MIGFESVSTWAQPEPPPASMARTELVRKIAEHIVGLSPGRLRVAVDGFTAAGKTSFGHELAGAVRSLGRPTARASIDDFKKPWRDAQEHGYDRTSGAGYYRNAYDFVSARELLLIPAGPGGTGRVALCAHDPLTGVDHRDVTVELPTDAVLIVDSVFAFRPEYDDLWDYRIWLDVDPEASLARGVARDTDAEGGVEEATRLHRDRYHAAELLYLAEVDPRAVADMVIDNRDFAAPRIARPGLLPAIDVVRRGSPVDGPGSARRLLGVFAHPDDEVFCAGGTMAHVAKAGGQVVVLSATRGERGEIRDAAAATRRTLGAVRESELRAACAELGVASNVRVLDFGDGTLPHHRSAVAAAIAECMREVRPDAVVTFGPDGGYGHPDHMVISDLTTEAFGSLVRERPEGQRLYHALFPPRTTSMAEELARWLVEVTPPAIGPDALRAIALFAGESSTMRLARDDVRVEWFPPGVCVIEQGEQADALYLILNGIVDVIQERSSGELVHLRRMAAGEFFGELGLVRGAVRSANVVAAESLTCLVLSRMPVTAYAGRGAGAASDAPSIGGTAPPGAVAVDVTPYLDQKLNALARHRSQYPIAQSLLPKGLLSQMLGTEFFLRAGMVASAGEDRR